ncbi:unnamed protein product [Thelazia callipaeda]|uniref:Uncharacterized protein n=1 Tax=Thelazia callipaeda TaxID=103827 RepID=A0A0N5D4E0_THECL|nr:unnamed protein product [Thelazia callipaeda]
MIHSGAITAPTQLTCRVQHVSSSTENASPIQNNSLITTTSASACSSVCGELLTIHAAHQSVVTYGNLPTPQLLPPPPTTHYFLSQKTTESNLNRTTSLISTGNRPSAFRPIIPTTSSELFVVTTLNSLMSSATHDSSHINCTDPNSQHQTASVLKNVYVS